LEIAPRTFFFSGKAAPAYQLAKLIVKSSIPGRHYRWRSSGSRPLEGGILPEYSASLAERLIPACDVSNQISTAGYEASGTSNMKFMMKWSADCRHA